MRKFKVKSFLQKATFRFGNEGIGEELLEDHRAGVGYHVHLQGLHELCLLTTDPGDEDSLGH